MRGRIGLVLLFFTMAALTACAAGGGRDKKGAALEGDGKEIVFKLIIDHPDLQQYFHPELTGRIPLKVKSADLAAAGPKIEKFGKPVEFFSSSAPLADAPYLEVISLHMESGRAVFELFYAEEGVSIKGVMLKQDGQWAFEDYEVYEN